jgi:hypothetical protein
MEPPTPSSATVSMMFVSGNLRNDSKQYDDTFIPSLTLAAQWAITKSFSDQLAPTVSNE